MEILFFVMLLCDFNTKQCQLPSGVMSPYFTDQRECERQSAQQSRLFRTVPVNSFDRNIYASCFKKTASGLAETIPDNGDFERDFRNGSIPISPAKP